MSVEHSSIFLHPLIEYYVIVYTEKILLLLFSLLPDFKFVCGQNMRQDCDQYSKQEAADYILRVVFIVRHPV